MAHDVIEAALKLDLTSWSADYYFTNYNQDPDVTQASQVPRHIYTCLADLVTGFGASNLTFDQLIVAEYGQKKVPTTACIIIQPTMVYEPALDFDFVSDNDFGAEKTYINILVKNTFTNSDYYRMRDIGLRIKYILDTKLRGLTYNQYMMVNSPNRLDPSVLVDNSIAPNSYFKMLWETSGLLESKEWAHKYCCVYSSYFNQY